MGIKIPGYTLTLLKRCMTFANNAYTGKSAFTGGTMEFYSTKNEQYKPVFFGYKYGDDLYITIRGSATDADFITDFDYAETTAKFGSNTINVHNGFYQAAKYVFEQTKTYMKETTGNIYITGHSYGASVSTVLGLMALTDSQTKNLKIGIIAIAPAPSVSALPSSLSPYIVNIINDGDIVPSMSIPNAYNVVAPLVPKGTFSKIIVKAALQTLLKVVSKKTEFSELFVEELSDSLDQIVDDLCAYKKDQSIITVKTLLGTTYQITESGSSSLASYKVTPTSIDSLVIGVDCINNHMGDVYISNFDHITSL